MKDTRNRLLAAVRDYKMPSAATALLNQNPPLIISAVTASGKNTVANYILNNQSKYRETVSHTTRSPRQGEIDGTHYWFVNELKMLELVQGQAFIEVKAIHGQTIYGTSIESYKKVIRRGHKPLLVIDVQGVETISQAVPLLRPYFILPPSYEEWMNRLHSRGVITEADKAERITSARRELQTILQNPAYIVVINDKIETTAQEILSGKFDEKIQLKNHQLAKKLLDQLKVGTHT